MIICGGENVYPAEVEAVLGAHPAVREVVVIGVDDETFGQRLVAYVVCADDVHGPPGHRRCGPRARPAGQLQGAARHRLPRRAAAQRVRQGHGPRPPGGCAVTGARMDGIDAGFLYMETPSVHMHTLKIAILEPRPGLTYDTFVTGLLARLKRLPPLRRRIVPVPFGLNHPVWVTLAAHRRGAPPPPAPDRRRGQHARPGDADRRDRQHATRPPAPAVGAALLRRTPRRPGRRGRQDAPRPRRRGRGQRPAGQRDRRAVGRAPRGAAGAEAATRTPSRATLVRDALRDAIVADRAVPASCVRTALGVAGVVRERGHGVRTPLPVLHAPRVSFNGSLTPRTVVHDGVAPAHGLQADPAAARRRHPQRPGPRRGLRRAAPLAGRPRRAPLVLAARRGPDRHRRARRRAATRRQPGLQPLHDARDRRRRPGRAAAAHLGDDDARPSGSSSCSGPRSSRTGRSSRRRTRSPQRSAPTRGSTPPRGTPPPSP